MIWWSFQSNPSKLSPGFDGVPSIAQRLDLVDRRLQKTNRNAWRKPCSSSHVARNSPLCYDSLNRHRTKHTATLETIPVRRFTSRDMYTDSIKSVSLRPTTCMSVARSRPAHAKELAPGTQMADIVVSSRGHRYPCERSTVMLRLI